MSVFIKHLSNIQIEILTIIQNFQTVFCQHFYLDGAHVEFMHSSRRINHKFRCHLKFYR